jgi:tetratricopeptide (TPR) repeat protein
VSAVSKWEMGSNRPDLELLPELAEIFQISIDSLLGYEKSYKKTDSVIEQINRLLEEEKYKEAGKEALTILQRYPNDIRINKLLADAYYSLCFSTNTNEGKKENIEKAIYYYERSIELFDEKRSCGYSEEDLYCNIATLYALEEMKRYDEAIEILEKYNGSGKYNNLIASYLFLAGNKVEAKNRVLKHCIGQQVFVFNDLSILADMYAKDEDYETALRFLETEIKSFELFMREEEGSYANRAYAGKAYIISEIYKKLGKQEEAENWYQKAKEHAEIYKQHPSMLISSMKYCEELEGRMIDSYGEVLERL